MINCIYLAIMITILKLLLVLEKSLYWTDKTTNYTYDRRVFGVFPLGIRRKGLMLAAAAWCLLSACRLLFAPILGLCLSPSFPASRVASVVSYSSRVRRTVVDCCHNSERERKMSRHYGGRYCCDFWKDLSYTGLCNLSSVPPLFFRHQEEGMGWNGMDGFGSNLV